MPLSSSKTNKTYLLKIISIIGFCVSIGFVNAQNNPNLSLEQADKLLITNNLDLLAAKYDINIAEAQKIQAKLFDNPDISFSVPIYSREFKWFDVGGNYVISLEQAIKIAGKRKAGIQLAESQKELATWQYEVLARQLKYALHNSYFTLYYTQQSIDKTQNEVSKIKRLIEALQIQYDKGNITLNELVRMKALYNSLSSNSLELKKTMNEEMNNLKTLLIVNPSQEIKISPTEKEINRYQFALIDLQEAIKKAENEQPEIKLAQANTLLNESQLKNEKKQSIPDLNLGLSYTKDGDYTSKVTYASIGFNIPLFNRNQGNIKAAEYAVKQSKLSEENQKNLMVNNITTAYNSILSIEEREKDIPADFETQFDSLMEQVSENYQKRNLSLLEFVDLIETYHEQVIENNNLKLNKIEAYEDFDYNSGYTLFK